MLLEKERVEWVPSLCVRKQSLAHHAALRGRIGILDRLQLHAPKALLRLRAVGCFNFGEGMVAVGTVIQSRSRKNGDWKLDGARLLVSERALGVKDAIIVSV